MKSIGAAPDEPCEIAYLEESDGFRAACGTMKIVLGLLVMASAVLVLMGSQMFGTEGFFQRIWNIIMSARADYYDIRADKPKRSGGMLLLGSDSMRTFRLLRFDYLLYSTQHDGRQSDLRHQAERLRAETFRQQRTRAALEGRVRQRRAKDLRRSR